MNVTNEQKTEIRNAFQTMKSKDDFLDLLNLVKRIIYGSKAVPFKLQQITFYANPSVSKQRYRAFTIIKKSGKQRIIHAPVQGLKAIQKCLNVVFQCMYDPPNEATGFVLGKSIVDNARRHVGSNFIYNLDLKNFFPSIDQARVWGRLKVPPFNLNESKGRLEINNIICALCCTNMEVERLNGSDNIVEIRNVLPQGAPTSPTLTNIICQQLDYYLSAVAKRFGLKYSRYADDITFSSMHNVYQHEGDFKKEIARLIEKHKFTINDSKTRLQKKGYRQEVTGLLVNERINLKKSFIKDIRKWLYYWEEYGYDKATQYYLSSISQQKLQNRRKPTLSLANAIYGRLQFFKMVKGANSPGYLKLNSRYQNLTGRIPEKRRDLDIEQYSVKTKVEVDYSVFPLQHSPKQLVKLLKQFSSDDSVLKYTTHSWDAGRDLKLFKDVNEFIEIAKKNYRSFSYQMNTLSRNLNGKIYNFLFNPEVSIRGWGLNNIKFGWSSKELRHACNDNPTLAPENFILPEAYQFQLHGKTIQRFKQVIDLFKNEIEIRDENDALLNLILAMHNEFLNGFSEPRITNLENKTFYTDVQWLTKALKLIFDNIHKRPQYPDVSYNVDDSIPDVYKLEVLHSGSFNRGKSIHDPKFSTMEGDFKDIKKYLHNLCDWSVESIFREGPYRLNFLVSNEVTPPYERLESAEGFKHILTFYK